MKTALIINGSKKFGNDGTRLNTTLHEVAKNELEARDYKVLETFIDKGYEPESEVQKIAQSELIIYQMPAWWMGEALGLSKNIWTKFLCAVMACYLAVMGAVERTRARNMAQADCRKAKG